MVVLGLGNSLRLFLPYSLLHFFLSRSHLQFFLSCGLLHFFLLAALSLFLSRYAIMLPALRCELFLSDFLLLLLPLLFDRLFRRDLLRKEPSAKRKEFDGFFLGQFGSRLK